MFQFRWSLICMTEACVAASSNLLGNSRSHYLGEGSHAGGCTPGWEVGRFPGAILGWG